MGVQGDGPCNCQSPETQVIPTTAELPTPDIPFYTIEPSKGWLRGMIERFKSVVRFGK